MEDEPERRQVRGNKNRMTGYVYLDPDEIYEPTQRRVSTISRDHVIKGKRTRRSVERSESPSVRFQRSRSRLSLDSEPELRETASALVLQPTKSAKTSSRKVFHGKAVRAIFPNLPRAKNPSDERSNPESNHSNKRIQRLESVTLNNVSSRPHGKRTINFIASDSLSSEDGKDTEKLSNLARELAQKQKEVRLQAKENRILKRQVQLLLARSDEMADLKIDLDDARTQNEELQRQINQPKGSTRRGSKVQNGDFEELQAQARTIQQLKSRLDTASQLNKLTLNPSLHHWARKPTDSKQGWMKIRTSVNLLASSLEEMLLVPKDLARSLENHENRQATVDLLESSFGNTQLLFSEPWLALRSLLFRFIRDFIFYSDIWQTFHCDGLIAREYQRVIGLSAPDGYLELFHKAAFYEILHDTDFKEYVLWPYRQDIREELMQFLAPLTSSTRLNEEIKNVQRQADTLIENAFSLRASCIPDAGERFEITCYKPGDVFDPETMKPEHSDGREMILPETFNKAYRVKVCVQGSMKQYVVEESMQGVDLLKVMSQPFLDRTEGCDSRGSIISEKACVVLELSHQ